MGILAATTVDMVIGKSLDAASLSVRVIANNIANVNTPRFKRSEVDFDSQLQSALAFVPSKMTLTHPRHIGDQPRMNLSEIRPEVILRSDTALRNDKNNVDVELEMGKLARLDIMYRSLLEFQRARMGMLRTAITEGR